MTSNFSFEKSLRLLNKSDFQNLRTGSRFFISDVLIFYVKENSVGKDRVGLAITKKYGNAVKRNGIKRIVREVFRCSGPKNGNLDIIVGMNLRKIKKEKLSHENVRARVSKSFSNAKKAKFKK